MSDNKKYYYLKFKDNFFEQDHIKVIEALENGYIFSNILLKMYLRSLKFDGKLMITEKIPYDKDKPEILAKVLGHDVSHLRECIEIATELEVIKILNTGEIYMLDIQNFIGHSTTEADRIRAYRHRIKEDETKAVTNVRQKNCKSTPEREKEKELKKDKKADKKTTIDKQPTIEYKEIIDYLNLKANKGYKYNIGSTKTLIKTRTKEGFSLADFKKVIDVKCKQWLTDTKMNRYLQPSTLFGTKFEGYLNEWQAPKQDKQYTCGPAEEHKPINME